MRWWRDATERVYKLMIVVLLSGSEVSLRVNLKRHFVDGLWLVPLYTIDPVDLPGEGG